MKHIAIILEHANKYLLTTVVYAIHMFICACNDPIGCSKTQQ